MNRLVIFAAGVAASLGFAAVWHGPMGAGESLAGRADRLARVTLDHYEMKAVTARVERDPLRRTLILSGPADRFQRGELVRVMGEVPGAERVRWDPAWPPRETRP